MKNSEDAVLQETENALRACVEGIPFLRVQAIRKAAGQGSVRADLVAEVELPTGRQTLIVEVKSNAQPRLAREAMMQILRCKEAYPGSYGILVGPYISPQTARMCAEGGVGYLDLSGNCRLSFAGVYIERGGRPNRFAEKRDLRSLYSAKASRVLRVLLADPKRAWTVSNLAIEAEVSLGLASKVKKLLLDREWAAPNERGVRLTKPEELLSEWASSYSFRRNEVQDYYSLRPVPQVEASLATFCLERGIRYALTAFSAAARLATAVGYQRTFAYVGDSIQDVVKELGLKKVGSGPNVTILKPYDAGVFYGARQVEDSMIASPIQVYLDLVSFKGRGEEAAEEVLREAIKPLW